MTVADLNSINGLYVSYYGRPADPQGQNFWVGQANEGISLEEISSSFATAPEALALYPYLRNPNTVPPEQFVNEIYQNCFGRAADAAGLAFWTKYLKDNGQAAVPTFILAITMGAQGTDKAALQNKADASEHFTSELNANNIDPNSTIMGNGRNIITPVNENPDTLVAANKKTDLFIMELVAASGQTFTLTTALDNIQGTAGNDSIIGDNSGTKTVQLGDFVNGGSGNDTFQYFGANGVVPQLVAVENVNLNQVGTDARLDFSLAVGLNQVLAINNPSSGTVDIKVNSGVTVGAQDISDNSVELYFDLGNAKDASLLFTNAKVSSLDLANNAAGNLINSQLTTVNIQAEGGNTLNAGLSTRNITKTLNFSGTGTFKIVDQLDDLITQIDASKNEGGVNLFLGDGKVKFTGGKGDDTVIFNEPSFNIEDVVDGGDGKNTLTLKGSPIDVITSNSRLLSAINATKNFETLGFDTSDSPADLVQLDVAAVTNGIKDYKYTGGSEFFAVNAQNDTKFTLTGFGGFPGTPTPLVNITNAVGQNTINLTLVRSGQQAAVVNTLQLGDNSSILNVDSTKINQLGTVTNVINNIRTTNPASGVNGLSLTLTGDQDIDILQPIATTAGIKVDGSAFTGKLKVDGTDLPPFVAGVDIPGDVLTGGSGNDTLNGRKGDDLLTGNAGNNTFLYNTTNLDSTAEGINAAGTPSSWDTIADFKPTSDKINLIATPFIASDYVGQVNVTNAANLKAATEFAANLIGADKIGYYQFGNNTYVYGDVNNSTAVEGNDLMIQLTGNLALPETSFIFVTV